MSGQELEYTRQEMKQGKGEKGWSCYEDVQARVGVHKTGDEARVRRDGHAMRMSRQELEYTRQEMKQGKGEKGWSCYEDVQARVGVHKTGDEARVRRDGHAMRMSRQELEYTRQEMKQGKGEKGWSCYEDVQARVGVHKTGDEARVRRDGHAMRMSRQELEYTRQEMKQGKGEKGWSCYEDVQARVGVHKTGDEARVRRDGHAMRMSRQELEYTRQEMKQGKGEKGWSCYEDVQARVGVHETGDEARVRRDGHAMRMSRQELEYTRQEMKQG
uniref:Uncharacterized protein n=1 Tax=Timema tahoe TaxID=61484 RepID=A0A7R9NV22_9NEOP|nr:unnamed protein product [Timema tahoe]